MSITDATTNLDTVYTEQSTVAFTAGTLSTIANCVTEVESKLKRGTLSASTKPTSTEVQTWLIRAKQELAAVRGFSYDRRYATVTTVASQYRYSMPPDYAGGHTSLRDTTNERQIQIWTPDWYDMKYPDPAAVSNGEPRVCCIKDRELWLYPPDGAYTLELSYERTGEDNTTTDFAWLPELERFRCCDFALAESFESLGRLDTAQYYRAKWTSGLQLSIRSDSKKKWAGKTLQCLSFQQHHNLTNR